MPRIATTINISNPKRYGYDLKLDDMLLRTAIAPGRDMTISEWHKIVDYFDEIQCCGQISDPIFNPYFIDFIKIAKEKDKYLMVHTAASQKPVKWYNEAFDNMGRGEWTFGIDGLPEESHKYRINQDGKKLFEMAKLCASKGIKTRWVYIIFKYNENHIKVKVWERGAGLTKACGTAACATAYAAKINGKIKNKTEIEFELGKLSIFIDESKNISMTGPVSNIDQINIKI